MYMYYMSLPGVWMEGVRGAGAPMVVASGVLGPVALIPHMCYFYCIISLQC